MTNTSAINEIQLLAASYEPIFLHEMAEVELQNRVDVKYMIPLHEVSEILASAKSSYRILEVNGERICGYDTLYYDTTDLQLYHEHHTGRLERFKIRLRTYLASDISFFEVKRKNNKNRTVKTRIEPNEVVHPTLDEEIASFIEAESSLRAENLVGDLKVHYQRITLVNLAQKERVTIDINLTFKHKEQEKSYSFMAILEIKQNRQGKSALTNLLKSLGRRPGAISKYCLGRISTNPDIKQNRFKRNILNINKIKHEHIARGSR